MPSASYLMTMLVESPAQIELISRDSLPFVRTTSSGAVTSIKIRWALTEPRFFSSSVNIPLSPALISLMPLALILKIGSAAPVSGAGSGDTVVSRHSVIANERSVKSPLMSEYPIINAKELLPPSHVHLSVMVYLSGSLSAQTFCISAASHLKLPMDLVKMISESSASEPFSRRSITLIVSSKGLFAVIEESGLDSSGVSASGSGIDITVYPRTSGFAAGSEASA